MRVRFCHRCCGAMTTKQENKLSMYLAVLAACEPHLTAIQALPAMDEAHADFHRHVANIQRITQLRDVTGTGIADDKRSLRTRMAESANAIALAIRAYAIKAGKPDVAAKANIPASRMNTGRDTAAAVTARNIHAMASEHLKGLERFGITPDKVDRLGIMIDAYAASIGKPRAAAAQGVTLTQQLAAEFDAADALLMDQMDALMRQFRAAEPAFVEAYRNARALVHLKATRGKPTPAAGQETTRAAS